MSSVESNPTLLLMKALIGSEFSGIDLLADRTWQFSFTGGDLLIKCQWKAIEAGLVVLTRSDHQQDYGLLEPIDGLAEIRKLLNDRIVEGIGIDRVTSGLSMTFTDDLRFEVFNVSSPYEGWFYADSTGLKLVPMGHERIIIWRGESYIIYKGAT